MGMDLGQYGLRHALARAAGQRKTTKREYDKQLAKLDQLRTALANLEEKASKSNATLVALDQQCAALEQALAHVYNDSAESVEPRQTFSKDHITAWGGLTRTALAVIKTCHPNPVGANLVTALVAKRLGLEFESARDYAFFRRKIGRTLKNMHHQGYLERIPLGCPSFVSYR